MSRVDRVPVVLEGRRAKMIQFVEATELIHELADDDELKDAVVTLAVHAGIAASDAICLRRLGYYWAGAGHHDALSHLRRADPAAAAHLTTLLGLKTRAGYGHESMTSANEMRAVRAMHHIVAAAQLS